MLASHLGERSWSTATTIRRSSGSATVSGRRAGPARRGRGGRDARGTAFVLGVQWELHEEWQDDERSLGVWRAFVRAAAERADVREAATVG